MALARLDNVRLHAICLLLASGAHALDTRDTSSDSPNTNVAMTVLYAVTGCVSVLFIIIIVSGAIRAIRHPERYGPRARRGDGEDDGQSRARGLTRAIIDTFPIVQFGSVRDPPPKDVESSTMEMNKENIPLPQDPPLPPTSEGTAPAPHGAVLLPDAELRITEVDPDRPSAPTGDQALQSDSAANKDIMPAAIGRDTCPICICNFEEGENLRVLPCDGAHRFHQDCVDPWLLELSTACPICRQDFIALEHMISGGSDASQDPQIRTSRIRRFSRYLRFARNPNRLSTSSASAQPAV
ncbi:hypothetical protein C8J57DRAFT_1284093 [Mycena rebaudengoi]|nr:hypothetical protein C8J57DRAFT_1284093 [Mycena rebaudengoi]